MMHPAFHRWAFILLVSIVILVPAVIVLSPSFMMAGGPVGHFWHDAYRETSPDGQYECISQVRVRFPANEFIDPSVTVRIVVKRAKGSSEIYRGTFILEEHSDYRTPVIVWKRSEVVVKGFDDRTDRILNVSF
jgi:hypothetical protein